MTETMTETIPAYQSASEIETGFFVESVWADTKGHEHVLAMQLPWFQAKSRETWRGCLLRILDKIQKAPTDERLKLQASNAYDRYSATALRIGILQEFVLKSEEYKPGTYRPGCAYVKISDEPLYLLAAACAHAAN